MYADTYSFHLTTPWGHLLIYSIHIKTPALFPHYQPLTFPLTQPTTSSNSLVSNQVLTYFTTYKKLPAAFPPTPTQMETAIKLRRQLIKELWERYIIRYTMPDWHWFPEGPDAEKRMLQLPFGLADRILAQILDEWKKLNVKDVSQLAAHQWDGIRRLVDDHVRAHFGALGM